MHLSHHISTTFIDIIMILPQTSVNTREFQPKIAVALFVTQDCVWLSKQPLSVPPLPKEQHYFIRDGVKAHARLIFCCSKAYRISVCWADCCYSVCRSFIGSWQWLWVSLRQTQCKIGKGCVRPSMRPLHSSYGTTIKSESSPDLTHSRGPDQFCITILLTWECQTSILRVIPSHLHKQLRLAFSCLCSRAESTTGEVLLYQKPLHCCSKVEIRLHHILFHSCMSNSNRTFSLRLSHG
jgi:hypothetical protein